MIRLRSKRQYILALEVLVHTLCVVCSAFLGNSSLDDGIAVLGQVSLPVIGADKVDGSPGDFGVNF
jgi:hypothetical protein